ncbi:nucleotidyltransferase family protein [Oscillospiraceae bacterium OttesenSCG-928-G22]|nr:nucleotidyltransferase family protein [Oscillospiraceae bacterium OttesenSCG-928-G22]
MKVCGIVAEYNPFHKGHLYHMRYSRDEITKQTGEPVAVVVVMSGNIVQRGDFAIFAKHRRAHSALLPPGGADLIFELPTPFACATAERFASSALSLLGATGLVDYLSFGSEAGDLAPLWKLAALHESEEFSLRIAEILEEGVTYAAARQRAAEEVLGEVGGFLRAPNNILAVEYLRAISCLSLPITPMTVSRVGPGHDSFEVKDKLASASIMRAMLLTDGAYSAMRYMPIEASNMVVDDISIGRGPVSLKQIDIAIMSHLRRLTLADFEALPDVSEGLPARLYSAVRESNSLDEAIAVAKTKRYTRARIRRQFLLAFLGVTAKDAAGAPPYLRVLGFTDRGRSLLKRMKETATLPVITKPAESDGLPGGAKETFLLESRISDLYRLACPSIAERDAGSEYTRSPIYVKR